jgi:hypothetical protein
MRNTANFHPEWGYLAPAPSFMRTVRAVLVATAVGVTLGAGAVFGWASHQATESSVGERTLVRSAEAVAALPQTSVQATKTDALSSTERRSLAESSRSAEGAAHEQAASPTTRAPAGITALAAAPAATEGRSVAAIAAPATAAKEPTPNVAPIKKKVMKKSNATWRFASRDESFGFAPGEYSRRRSWGGYYGDGGGRRYENW